MSDTIQPLTRTEHALLRTRVTNLDRTERTFYHRPYGASSQHARTETSRVGGKAPFIRSLSYTIISPHRDRHATYGRSTDHCYEPLVRHATDSSFRSVLRWAARGPKETMMSDKRYSKVEEEIIQILDKLEKEEPAPSRPNLRLVHSRPTRARRRSFRDRLPRIALPSPGVTLAMVFGFALMALFTTGTLQLAATLLTIGALVLLFTRRGQTSDWNGPSGTKTWRGQDITFGSQSKDSAGDRARRWLDERRGRIR